MTRLSNKRGLPHRTALAIGLFVAIAWHGRTALAQDLIETPYDPTFERSIFARHRTAQDARQGCRESLAACIAEIDRICTLNAAQKEKLQLVGQGDIKRFFDSVETARAELKKDSDPRRGAQIFDATSALRMTYLSGLFHEHSLFRKTMPNVLDARQLAVYFQEVEKSRRHRHEDNAKRVVSLIETSVYLSSSERDEFLDLIVREIPACLSDGPYEVHYLLLQTGRLVEERPERFPNRRLRESILDYKHQFESIEPVLRRAGYFPEEEIEQPTRSRPRDLESKPESSL